MSELTNHCRMLLGLDAAWRVEQVQFSINDKQVEIHLSHVGTQLTCPECGKSCSQADLAPQRTWRHLDTMQFQTVIHARLPRANCEQCGVKTTLAPLRAPLVDRVSSSNRRAAWSTGLIMRDSR